MKQHKIIWLTLGIWLSLNAFLGAYAVTTHIHDEVQTEIVAKGMLRKHITRYTTDGWLNI
ncbi:MAG: hypothetical protein H7Y41_06925, partial [Hyphomonadaceae bacterium]|nr:hypothetical protein [Clostridia bacterium]